MRIILTKIPVQFRHSFRAPVASDSLWRQLDNGYRRTMDSLWTMKAGEACEILEYDSALAEPYKVRLMEFGFHPGETVTCLQAPAFGAPKVYRVSNTVFSLDDDVASHVLVKPRG